MFSLANRVALVTGASRGIGRATALALSQQGAAVTVCARTESALEDVAEAIRQRDGKALVQVCDITDKGATEAAVTATVEAFGRLDVLVNNAGITRDALLVRMRDEDWEAVLTTNLTGAFYFTRAATRIMMKQRSGRIINISSVVGLHGNAGQANYAASKAGLLGMTKSLSKELGTRGITVNAITPGFITTEMTAQLPDETQNRLRELIALGYFGTAEDVAATVCFLASDEARYITGEVIRVDGGIRL